MCGVAVVGVPDVSVQVLRLACDALCMLRAAGRADGDGRDVPAGRYFAFMRRLRVGRERADAAATWLRRSGVIAVTVDHSTIHIPDAWDGSLPADSPTPAGDGTPGDKFVE